MHAEAVTQVGRPACRQKETGRHVEMHACRKQADSRQADRQADRQASGRQKEIGRQVKIHACRK
jgi:hypothetical protein